MKALKTITFVLIPVLTFLFHSCGKYPDGPNFSILSRKSRLENVWKQKETLHTDGTVEYNPTPGYTTEFTDEEEIIYTNDVITLKGEWELINDKKDLLITYPGIGSMKYEIRRLKANELWLKNTNGEF